jgi:hypothetical protein
MQRLYPRIARVTSLWAMVVTGLPLGITACHATGGGRGGHIEACSLISAAEAGKVLGASVTVTPQDTSLAGSSAASICHYRPRQKGGGFMLLAGRVHYTSAAREVAERKREALSDTPPGVGKPTFEDVKGLGDAAYLARSSGFFQLHVLKHGAVVVINMNRAPDGAGVAQAEQLARVALGHLK